MKLENVNKALATNESARGQVKLILGQVDLSSVERSKAEEELEKLDEEREYLRRWKSAKSAEGGQA